MSYINVQNQSLRSALVANFLIAELLASRTTADYLLWLISPWVTNFGLNLPAGGNIAALVDSSENRPTLFEVLHQIVLNGGQVRLVIRPETEQYRVKRFIEPLIQLVAAEPGILVRSHADLHAKIYVGHQGALHGSLNLTESGIERNLEFSTYYSDARNIALLRAEAESLFEASEALV